MDGWRQILNNYMQSAKKMEYLAYDAPTQSMFSVISQMGVTHQMNQPVQRTKFSGSVLWDVSDVVSFEVLCAYSFSLSLPFP